MVQETTTLLMVRTYSQFVMTLDNLVIKLIKEEVYFVIVGIYNSVVIF